MSKIALYATRALRAPLVAAGAWATVAPGERAELQPEANRTMAATLGMTVRLMSAFLFAEG
jgi:hypothetical protein